ncbi:hypothetical protein EB093_05895 [bacterium]|nr:hypothetical protein [bacterium]
MSKLAYKLNFLSTESIEGQADRLVLVDEKNVLTVRFGHAPLISVVKNGTLSVVIDGATTSYSFGSGLVRVGAFGCTVTILN